MVSNKKRSKMALSDWEFPDALYSVMSSSKSLNLSSAIWECPNYILITDEALTADKIRVTSGKKFHLIGQKLWYLNQIGTATREWKNNHKKKQNHQKIITNHKKTTTKKLNI